MWSQPPGGVTAPPLAPSHSLPLGTQCADSSTALGCPPGTGGGIALRFSAQHQSTDGGDSCYPRNVSCAWPQKSPQTHAHGPLPEKDLRMCQVRGDQQEVIHQTQEQPSEETHGRGAHTWGHTCTASDDLSLCGIRTGRGRRAGAGAQASAATCPRVLGHSVHAQGPPVKMGHAARVGAQSVRREEAVTAPRRGPYPSCWIPGNTLLSMSP